MGYSISWLGLPLPKGEALHLLGFKDTGKPDEANEAPFSAAYLPNKWTVLWSNDFEYGVPEHHNGLSANIDILSCQVEEHVMFSACHWLSNGELRWSVWHDAQQGVYDVNTLGEPPKTLNHIEATLKAKQDANGGSKGEVDYVFDVPLELAYQISSYKHDMWKFAWGEPRFTIIERGR